MLVRRLARPMLSSIFVYAGFNSVRNPDHAAPAAAPVVDKLRSVLPGPVAGLVPADPAAAVRLNGGVQVVSGLLLATGRVPRLASLALAGSLVPTTLAGHAFWQEDDPAKRKQQQLQFLKNVSLLGGLLLAAVDTEGKPSVAWRGRAAAHRTGEAVVAALPSGSDSSDTVSSLKETLGHVADAAKEHGAHLADVMREQAPVVADAAKEHGAHLADVVREQAPVVADAAKEHGAHLADVVREQAPVVADAAKEHGAHLADVVKEQAPVVADAARQHGEAVAAAAREQAPVVTDAVREHGDELSKRAAKRAAKAARKARAQLT